MYLVLSVETSSAEELKESLVVAQSLLDEARYRIPSAVTHAANLDRVIQEINRRHLGGEE